MDAADAVDPDEQIEAEREPSNPQTEISAHRSAPDRVVFTEDGNTDGWIALDADSAVSLRR